MKTNDLFYQSSGPTSDATDCEDTLPIYPRYDALDLDEIELTEEQIKIIAYEQIGSSMDEE